MGSRLDLGTKTYEKMFAQLKCWNPDSICVTLCERAYQPPHPWGGWSMRGDWSKDSDGKYNDERSRYATGLDRDVDQGGTGEWRVGLTNFCKFLKDRNISVKYFEIMNEPGFDEKAYAKTNEQIRLCGDCVTDYPRLLKTSWNVIKDAELPGKPMVISGSLISGTGVAWPQYTCGDYPPHGRDDYEYYRNPAVRKALMSYSDALSIHFFNKPYDRSVVASTELHERDKKLLHIMGNPQSSWTSGYNYMRSQLFTGTQMDNLGKVHSWMEKPIFVTSYGTPWGVHTDPDPDKNLNWYNPSDVPDMEVVKKQLKLKSGCGLDGLFHNTSCAGAWYFNDCVVGFRNVMWSEKDLYGLGMTHSKEVFSTAPSRPADASKWVREHKKDLWDSFKTWIQITDSLR